MEQDRLLPAVEGWLSRLAGLVLPDQGTDQTLNVVVELALEAVEGVDGASVALAGDSAYRLGNPSASDPAVLAFDDAQRLAGAGPCVEVLRRGEEVWWEPGDGRWPEVAGEAPGALVWALPLRAAEHLVGVLGLHSSRPGDLGPEAASTGRLLAHYGGVTLHNATALTGAELTSRHLQTALENRDVIGQAKGILMAKRNITAEEAFDMLRRVSQRSGKKLREVAADVVARYGALEGH